ncbi:uroporphyrinogen-III C-methyltransferase [Shewanella sp. BF02_Schw]|jgi:uroporphyrin-3 C-methyltransferase|uniref:uroporphyrinogen-III C-methyltransferase n=1 Tax=unclassified Shewanella TaxID=196818 RepID=UPI00177BC664|nr:uroporphyrinogen-III C-methyltransferase [Shewanella sp. BF02_Schw]MBO1896476.1 uroporphyrinogen-III C-methyltransferase [Shewanella sp. BF02_Schw]
MENNKKDPNPPAHKDEKVISPAPSPVEKPAQTKKGNATSQKSADSKTNNNQANSSANSPVNNSRRKAKPSSWWIRLGVLFSLLVAIVAIAACYWLYLQLDQQSNGQTQLGQNISEQVTQNKSLKYELQQTAMATNKRIGTLEQQQLNDTKAYAKLAQLQQSNKQLQERVAVIAQRSPNHWMASEAEYLVRMAGRKLWLENDPQTAIGLLQSADERISAMKDPALTVLRKALADDITKVKALKTTDITNTIFDLDTLIDGLTQLPLNRVDENFADNKSTQQVTDSIDDWQQNLARTWHDLTDGFITIRKRTTDLEPLLSPEQQWYLVENIRNKLLQAQLALYRFDQLNYQHSISLADKWLQQYFDLSDPKTKTMIASLDKLAKVNIEKITLNKFQASPLLQQLVIYGEIMPTGEPTQ